MWIAWTRDAISRYSPPEKVEDSDDLVDDMVHVAASYADGMLDELDKRYGGGSGDSGGRRGKRRAPDPD